MANHHATTVITGGPVAPMTRKEFLRKWHRFECERDVCQRSFFRPSDGKQASRAKICPRCQSK